MNFKQYILTENKIYLATKVGDILTAVQELRDDAKNMGSRDLIRFSERIVSQIRRILHSNWPKEEVKYLKVLQKVAVALMKAIEEKDDLGTIIAGIATTLEKLVSNLGLPINKLAASDQVQSQDKVGVSSSEKPTPKIMAGNSNQNAQNLAVPALGNQPSGNNLMQS